MDADINTVHAIYNTMSSLDAKLNGDLENILKIPIAGMFAL